MSVPSLRSLPLLASLLVPAIALASNPVTNPGFETVETTTGPFPTTFGDWTSDVTSIVTMQDMIQPYEGVRMLRFVNTSQEGPSNTGSSEALQLVDFSPYANLVQNGYTKAVVTFRANRIPGDVQTDRRFSIYLEAHSGSPGDFPSKWTISPLATGGGSLITDADPGTWELVTAEIRLPANTDYLAIDISADEDIFNDVVGPELDGHYADDVRVAIVPAVPNATPIALAGMGIAALGVGLLVMRRRMGEGGLVA